jgi:hypothetical protein
MSIHIARDDSPSDVVPGLTDDELISLVDRVAANPALWRHLVTHNCHEVTFALVCGDELVEVWVRASGTSVTFHALAPAAARAAAGPVAA